MSGFAATGEFATTEFESSAIILQYVGIGSILFSGQGEFGPGFSFYYEGVGSIVFYGYSWVTRVERAPPSWVHAGNVADSWSKQTEASSDWERVNGSGNI